MDPRGTNFLQQQGLPSGSGLMEDRSPPRAAAAVPRAHWTRDGLRPPGGARGPAGSELSPAGLHRSDPGSRSGRSRQPGPAPDGRGPAAPRPLFPTLPGAQLARPDAGRPAGTVPSPYSRWLSGGCHSAVTCPSPRQGSADQLITRGKARAPGRPRPPLWRVTPRLRPAVSPAHSRRGRGRASEFRTSRSCCLERVVPCAAG